jgi:RND family efflux transporter MFP subunit
MNPMKKNPSKLKLFVKKRYKLLIILAVALVGMGVFLYNKAQANKVELTFEHPVRQDITQTLEISGIIDATERVSMRFAAGGKVVYLGAQEGDWVKKWQTIATIDRRDLQNRLEKDLNLYLKERYDWDQQLDDIQDRTIDKEEERSVDKNQLDLNNVVLDVEYRDIAITNTVLSSPFEGILVSSPLTVTGVNLLATDVFEIVNPATLVFKALVDEADIALVQTGQNARLSLDAYENLQLSSTVEKISYKSTPSSSGTAFIVEFPVVDPATTIDTALKKYRLGMNGDVEIILEEKSDVLTVPLIATREENGKTYVDVKINEETIEPREIEVGLETDEDVEVLSGLNENDEVLIPE